MAGLSDATAGSGRKLTPEQLREILAMRQSQQSVSNGGDTGYTQWSDPSKTYDPATDTHGYTLYRQHGWNQEGSGDAMTPRRDVSKDQEYIMQVRPGTDGKLGDKWDLEGNYIGTYEAQDGGGKQFNQAAVMFGGALGGMYAQGMQGTNAGGASTSGAWNGVDFSGTAASGANTSAGTSVLDSFATGGGFAAGEGATLTGSSALTSGAGNTVLGTTIADAGLMTTAGGSAAGGLTLADAGTAVSGANQVSNAANNGNQRTNLPANGWDTLARIGTGAVVSAVAADAASDPVDTGKFDQLFNAMLTEQTRNSARSEDMWQNYLTTFRPLEQKLATAAAGYDTPERRERAAQEASGLVASSYDEQRTQAEREMVRAGMDPSTIQALGGSSRLMQAKDEAGAANKARTDTEATGLNLLSSVANFGRGNANIGLQASNAATSNTSGANSAATTGANAQNNNTNQRNSIFGDVLGAGLQAWGMGLFDAKPAGN